MKKSYCVFLLSIALLLTTGCSADDTENSIFTDNTNNTYLQNIPDANDVTHNDSQAERGGEQENIAELATESTGTLAVENLIMPEFYYCNINGASVTDDYFIYSTDSTYGEMFSLVCFLDGGTRSIVLAVFLPESKCASNVVLRGDELTDNVFIYYMDINDYTVSELLSSQNPESFSNAEFILYDYSAKDSAVWSVKADIATPNGASLSFDIVGASGYISENALNSTSSSSNDGTCLYCHGSGRCNTCNGLGYWYVSGITSDCSTCKGSGDCYYCEGTGIQVWLVRDVPIY